uniref:Uncharacterized protein n=1 Tax=Manihot esculenta TaxID=3983 RepID=A0A2C9VM21_MANES
MVRMLRPTSLSHAVEAAKWQEMLILSTGKGSYGSSRNFSTYTKPTPNSQLPFIPKTLQSFPFAPKPPNEINPSNQTSTSTKQAITSLSSQNSVNKPANQTRLGCYNSHNKYYPSHQCKQKSVMTLQMENQEVEGRLEENVQEQKEGEVLEAEQDITLSIHAIDGKQGQDTIRIVGNSKGNQMMILVDSGSTNSFIDEKAANALKLPVILVPKTVVTVADGRKLQSSSVRMDFKWKMDGIQF